MNTNAVKRFKVSLTYRSNLIIPDGIHTKARLLDITMRDSTQKLLVPSINLDETLFIVRQSQPLIRPRARANGIGVTTTCGGGVQANLALDATILAELEGGDVAGQVG